MKVMVTTEEGAVVDEEHYGPSAEETANDLRLVGILQTAPKIEPSKAFSRLVDRLKGELG